VSEQEKFRFSHKLRVRYSEIDGQKIVFNAHYMTYLDVAIYEYFREVLGDREVKELAEQHVFDVALVKSTLEYKGSARFDDILRIDGRIAKIGNSSFTFVANIVREQTGETVVSAEIIYVNYNVSHGKSQPIPESVRRKIEAYEGMNG